jgi:single-stranded-DNA-specific exonuclease
VWWGHYKDELPTGRCVAIAELDYNTYKKRYEIRLLAVRSTADSSVELNSACYLATVKTSSYPEILDWRKASDANVPPEMFNAGRMPAPQEHSAPQPLEQTLIVKECPTTWDDLRAWVRRSLYHNQQLVLAWKEPQLVPPSQIWQHLVGIAKYLSRTSQTVTRLQLHQKLYISDQSLQLGFQALTLLGFKVSFQDRSFKISATPVVEPTVSETTCLQAIEKFLAAVREEQFQRQYFYEVPLSTIQAIALATAFNQLDEF